MQQNIQVKNIFYHTLLTTATYSDFQKILASVYVF